MSAYFKLTKFGIGIFVMISGLAGFATSYPINEPFDFQRAIVLLLGLYFVSAGSFALNQAQEWSIDKKMPRTADRPIPMGLIQPWQAYVLGVLFSLLGVFLLWVLNEQSALWSVVTVLFYNGLYTLYWKKKWAFGAVPGAIPGAMPVIIGYVANSGTVLTPI